MAHNPINPYCGRAERITNASKIPHTMIAAIYARKSRPEEGRHETEKSVTRQKDEARAYIERKGWTRGPVFEDDAISGKHGEDRRPGLKALLAAAEQEPRPFDVVVMAADDRLMRDQWKSALTLPASTRRACACSSIRKIARRNSPTRRAASWKASGAYSSEMYRESVTRHMTDALKRKAKAGHVHGGRVFGYDNVRVDGHVERQINATEGSCGAADLRAVREGADTEADRRRSDGGQRPNARHARAAGRRAPRGRKPASARSCSAKLYRGVMLSTLGGPRPFRVDKPELRLIDAPLWDAVHARLDGQRQVYLDDARQTLRQPVEQHGVEVSPHGAADVRRAFRGRALAAARG